MKRALLVITLASCGAGAPAPASPSPATVARGTTDAGPDLESKPVAVEWTKYGYFGIYHYSGPSHRKNEAFEAADGKAHADFEAASLAAEKGDHQAAAKLFFSCAVQYRATPDQALALEFAIKNATLCYKNAMYAFANAGGFARHGQPLLEQAALNDPRLTAALWGLLAQAPRGCVAPQ